MSFYKTIENLLLKLDKFQDKEGKLLKSLVIDSAFKIDSDLIELLIINEQAKTKFFKEIAGHWVFNINDFILFIQDKNFLDDSYTRFKNKIGLNIDDKFLNQRKEVALVWPYKDCVLEGNQDKEDTKRQEIFFNEVLAQDEIDRLLDPKVLVNWTRHTAQGEVKFSSVEEYPQSGGGVFDMQNKTETPRQSSTATAQEGNILKRHPDGTLAENLLIKGNNLLALHTLKKQFRNKVKLIYIDPPYNTGNDSFGYNDNFNHSTWLTFMKNRLEVARELLRDNGVIFVQCDYNEDAYLKVLIDEVFGIENFVANIAVKSSTPSGTKTAHKDKKIIKQKDTILFYKKNQIKIKPQYTARENWDTHYSLFINKKDGVYSFKKLIDVLKENGFIYNKLEEINPTDEKIRQFIIQNKENICRLQSHTNKDIDKLSRTQYKDVVFEDIQNGEIKGLYFNGQVITPISQGIKTVLYGKNKKEYWSILLCDFWHDIDFQNTQNEGGVSLTNGKKPEALIQRIIEMSTETSDIVLDYHLGSGTTCAVAHKMGRQYIGIEQMDYIETIAVERLKKVIGKSEKRKISEEERTGLQEILEKLTNANNSLM